MKKFCLTLIFIVCFWFPAFADMGEEEIDFLLFAPDSSNSFVNQEQEMIHLDNLARYLRSRNIGPGQIHVHGYAAAVKNDIDPMGLSMARAVFIINELQRRGVPGHLFSEPTAHGEVDLWGANIAEADRNPNRRVRITVDGYYLPAVAFFAVEETTRSRFPLELLFPLLAILALILLFALRQRRPSAGKAINKPIAVAAVAASENLVNLEEEIRRRAYELYLERSGENGDAEGDWYRAVTEIRAQYEALVYQVYTEDGCWWAHRHNE